MIRLGVWTVLVGSGDEGVSGWLKMVFFLW